MSDFKLTPADRMSPLWRALHEHLTNRLATPEKTARLRGQIAEVKALLAMNEEPRRPVN